MRAPRHSAPNELCAPIQRPSAGRGASARAIPRPAGRFARRHHRGWPLAGPARPGADAFTMSESAIALGGWAREERAVPAA